MDPKLAPSSTPPQAAGISKTDDSNARPLRWTTVVKVRLVLFAQAIRPHWFQFMLLAILSGNIGAVYAVTDFCQAYMAGTKPYNIYYVSSYAVSTSFLVSFGAVKAVCDLIVGMLADRIGRRCMHAVGWAFGILLPVMIIAGKNWPTMVAADVFLGVQQGLSWTSAVFMLIDYATRRNAGVGVGVSELPFSLRHTWCPCVHILQHHQLVMHESKCICFMYCSNIGLVAAKPACAFLLWAAVMPPAIARLDVSCSA